MSHEAKIEQATIGLERAEVVRKDVELRLRSSNSGRQALKDRGLKNLVLDHRINEMTEAANRWVSLHG